MLCELGRESAINHSELKAFAAAGYVGLKCWTEYFKSVKSYKETKNKTSMR